MTTTVVIGMDMADASAYAAKHHPNDELILVTPRSPYGARGRTADRVVTTRAADALSNITQLLAEVHPAIITEPPAPKPVLAKTIDIDTKTGKTLIDGVELPYYLAREPIVAEVSPDSMGIVRLPIAVDIAGTVTIHHGEDPAS